MNDIEKTYFHLEDTYLDIVKQYLKINENNIEGALFQHTGIYAFFGAVLAYAKREMDRAATARDQEEAKVREAQRASLVSEGKKATDRALDAYVKTVTTVATHETSCEKTSHLYYLAKNVMNSLDHQKDMLVQISANKRAEAKLVGDYPTG